MPEGKSHPINPGSEKDFLKAMAPIFAMKSAEHKRLMREEHPDETLRGLGFTSTARTTEISPAPLTEDSN